MLKGVLIEADSDFAFCIPARLPSGRKPSLSTKRQNSFWKKNPGGNKESLSIWLESFWAHKSSQRKVDNLYRFMILIAVHCISSDHYIIKSNQFWFQSVRHQRWTYSNIHKRCQHWEPKLEWPNRVYPVQFRLTFWSVFARNGQTTTG